VRGDSRRDLYSKVLALCGLGVLAGAGAVVDYWPVGIRFPATESPLAVVPAAAVPAHDADDPLTVLAGLLEAPRTSRQPALSGGPDAPIPVTPDAPYESLPALPVGFAIGTAIAIQSLPAPAFLNVRHEVPVLPGEPVRLEAPLPHVRSTLASADRQGGFLGTAFRKTGSSLVRTGVKTGASVVDAVRVVGGLFRRVLPD